MKRQKALPWVLFGIAALAALALPTLLTAAYASKYGFLSVPIASWFVLALTGFTLVASGLVCYCFWRYYRRAERELADLRGHPLDDEIPAIHGHRQLDRAEFLPLIQILFRRPTDVKHVHVKPLPGGHGGDTTVLARRQRQGEENALLKSYVVKLGDKREMADEHDKFIRYVQDYLPSAARFFRYAEWESFAGIAYEFVGLEPRHDIQSFYQFYTGRAPIEVCELVEEIYTHLAQAWYQNGQQEKVDLYDEYHLLHRKREAIIGHVGELVADDDPYRANFTAIEERLQPNLMPAFAPPTNIPWHDPVAFLRTWPRRTLSLPVRRATVHGDLHAQNVLIEIGRNDHRRPWFIDFSHSGNGRSAARTREAIREGVPIDPDQGHTLRDFARLEADVKCILTALENADDLQRAVDFERALLNGGMSLHELPAKSSASEVLTEERFQKAWLAVREIRRQAALQLVNPDDVRPYTLSLLSATLPIVYYHRDQFESEACERQQKRYALLSAGMLCSQL
jgi:hypothetical protein